ncbi:MAG TPA: acyltransferase [Candidatus Polarisedimenticolaceae bacterium]|nr:acyltransferase [Candidatus Polarisedimenticolaceae bacterium]
MSKIAKRLFGNTAPYRFAAWLVGRYQEEQAAIRRPDEFREFGQGVVIEPGVRITMPGRVVLKDRVSIYRGSFINSAGGLYIGENTGIGYDCTIFTTQHRYRNARSIPFDNVVELKPVIIREFVWTGAGVMIMPGVEIGEGAIVGMGAVVTKSVPPLAIVLGNPAQIIGYRDKEHFASCKAEGKFQTIAIERYEETVPEAFRWKYPKEMKELGLD